MIIDSHAHVMTPTAEQLRLMNEAGVHKTILFSTTPHPERAGNLQEFEAEFALLTEILSGRMTDVERNKTIARTTEELCAVLRVNPDRFYGFGNVPLNIPYKETRLWIEQYVIGNGLKGIGELSPMTGHMEMLKSVFEAVEEYKNLPLWVHTFHPISRADIIELAALCENHPTVPVIWGHMGGTNWLDAIKLAKKHRNIFLDLSATFTTLAPGFAMRELPDRTLFSSDAPYGNPELSRKMVERMSPNDKVTEQVLGGNIAKMLNI